MISYDWLGGALAEWSKGLLLREKIKKKLKDPGFDFGLANL